VATYPNPWSRRTRSCPLDLGCSVSSSSSSAAPPSSSWFRAFGWHRRVALHFFIIHSLSLAAAARPTCFRFIPAAWTLSRMSFDKFGPSKHRVFIKTVFWDCKNARRIFILRVGNLLENDVDFLHNCYALTLSVRSMLFHIKTRCDTLRHVTRYDMRHVTTCDTLWHVTRYDMWHVMTCDTLRHVTRYDMWYITTCYVHGCSLILSFSALAVATTKLLISYPHARIFKLIAWLFNINLCTFWLKNVVITNRSYHFISLLRVCMSPWVLRALLLFYSEFKFVRFCQSLIDTACVRRSLRGSPL